MVENTDSAYSLPEKGMVGNHAVFDPAVLEVPSINQQFKDQYSEQETQVQVKRHGQWILITYLIS